MSGVSVGAWYRDRRLARMDRMARGLNGMPGRIGPGETSADAILPNKLKVTLKTLPVQLSIAKDVEISMKTTAENPPEPRTAADKAFLDELEAHARSLGIAKIGYTEVLPGDVFKGRSVPFSHAIVLISEMDKTAVDKAPSKETQAIGLITYSQLGKRTNALVEFLRKKGYAAEAGHPAIGPALYPRLAMRAGLGYPGRHGLLITPEFGPRQRISAVFTSIENLPLAEENPHVWIKDFCATCGNCVRRCPSQAIRGAPIEHPDGRRSHVDGDKCISCTVCMKECSFNKRGYQAVKELRTSMDGPRPR